MTISSIILIFKNINLKSFNIQNCFAGRIKGFHFINCPAYINGLITFSKSLVKKKLSDKYHYHKTVEDLHKHISPKYLPKDLGGQEQTNDEIIGN